MSTSAPLEVQSTGQDFRTGERRLSCDSDAVRGPRVETIGDAQRAGVSLTSRKLTKLYRTCGWSPTRFAQRRSSASSPHVPPRITTWPSSNRERRPLAHAARHVHASVDRRVHRVRADGCRTRRAGDGCAHVRERGIEAIAPRIRAPVDAARGLLPLLFGRETHRAALDLRAPPPRTPPRRRARSRSRATADPNRRGASTPSRRASRTRRARRTVRPLRVRASRARSIGSASRKTFHSALVTHVRRTKRSRDRRPAAIDGLARQRVSAHPERTRGHEDPPVADRVGRPDAHARRVVLAALERDRVPRGREARGLRSRRGSSRRRARAAGAGARASRSVRARAAGRARRSDGRAPSPARRSKGSAPRAHAARRPSGRVLRQHALAGDRRLARVAACLHVLHPHHPELREDLAGLRIRRHEPARRGRLLGGFEPRRVALALERRDPILRFPVLIPRSYARTAAGPGGHADPGPAA